ncbi:T9SS type A sorting domain-containing protein [bacterium SCSIO 12643]|nr:T9SS type A sorting domain-containing protein [bacterium SCSIO 12643]
MNSRKLVLTTLLTSTILGLSITIYWTNKTETNASKRIAYEAFLKDHPYSAPVDYLKVSKTPKHDRPDLAYRQDFLATMNPQTGRPEAEKLIPIREMIHSLKSSAQSHRAPGSNTSPWTSRGPNNIGGRTRAVAWDPNVNNKVWAGGVSGGLWYNPNITDSTSSWVSVNDFWENLAIGAIAFDPNNTSIMYVATGEYYLATNNGAGIWKSTDAGNSFTRLSSTTSFYAANDMIVRNENGASVIYAAISANHVLGTWFGTNTEGLQRSTDGGLTWTQVLPNASGSPIKVSDMDLAANNDLWIGTGQNSAGGGGGRVYSSSDGINFTLKHQHSSPKRVVLSCAQSDSNYVYAAFETNLKLGAIKQTTDYGNTWVTRSKPNDADIDIPADDFTRWQAWFDLTIAVDPNDKDAVIIGGIDLFKTQNEGITWNQISHWESKYGFQYVHADQHAIVYKPDSSSYVLFGNDGGVFYSSNATQNMPTIGSRNYGYNVTQFYSCDIHPNAGSNYFLGGTQDNGTQQFTIPGVNSTHTVSGGDGCYCHIDQTNPDYQSSSYVFNYFFHSFDGGVTFDSINMDYTTGKFINPSDYDDHLNILYTYKTHTSLYRVTNFESTSPVIGSVNIPDIQATAASVKVSPHTTYATNLFIGTDAGRIFKITNAHTTPTSTEITGSSFPVGSISCIELGQNENEILATFTNYGINSLWYTNNGGISWTSKEGNLPDMPIRWALFNPLNYNEVIVGTEVGVWSTTDFNSTSPTWTPSINGMANVRVDMFKLRSSDNEVIAATHGRGLFSSNAFSPSINTPTYCLSSSANSPCDEFISNVTIGAINNSTNCDNYSDFSNQYTTAYKGEILPISISTLNNSGAAGTNGNQLAVWIDWNNNKSFTDAGEQVYQITYTPGTTAPISFNLNVPANLNNDTVRMRVRMSRYQTFGPIVPCGTSLWGEVEDYSLIIKDAPVITWNTTVQDTQITCDISPLPTITGTPAAITTCDSSGVQISYVDSLTNGVCNHNYSITRTWTAFDSCGTMDTLVQHITIKDSIAPTITCPSPQTILATNGSSVSVPNYIDSANVSDNCSNINDIIITQNPSAGTIIPIGTSSVTLTAMDECGNTNSCSFPLIVNSVIGISEITAQSIRVYPNPSTGIFQIDLTKVYRQIESLQIYDLNGQSIYKQDDSFSGKLNTIHLTDVQKGTYYIMIQIADKRLLKKIILL